MILVGFFIAATASELTMLMLGKEYWSASQFIVGGVLAELARVAKGVYGMIVHARMNTKLLITPSLIGAIISVGLIWGLMPTFQSNSVGVTLMLSSVTVFILTYVATRNEYKLIFLRGYS